MARPDYAPPRGYNLALLRAGRMTAQEATDAMTRGEACPVLDIAEGPIGVIRALMVRMGPLDIDRLHTLAHFRFADDGTCAFALWTIEPPVGYDVEDTYARAWRDNRAAMNRA